MEDFMLLDQNIIHIRYGQYNDILTKLGNYKILGIPTIAELAPSKTLKSSISKAYKEVKTLNTDNLDNLRSFDIIQYFCYISTAQLIGFLQKSIFNKQGKISQTLTEWAWAIINNYKYEEADTKNLLRLFDTYPPFYIILKSLTNQSDNKFTEKLERPSRDELFDQIRCTSLLSAFIELLITEEMFGHDEETYNITIDFLGRFTENP
jgi:hypothetical protein